MEKQSVRPADDEIEHVVTTYSNMLFKLCFSMLGGNSDAEDAVSDTLIRYITKAPAFHEEEHRKAWLIRVAVNICNDMCRFRKRNDFINIDELTEHCARETGRTVLEEVMRLPVKYKTVIHLFYIEGYKTDEIAQILSVSPAAVRKRLQYGREMLKLEFEKEDRE